MVHCNRSKHCTKEVDDLQIALPWHVAEVTTPVEEVHVDERRVSELDDEDTIPGTARIGPRSIFLERVWKLSRIKPVFG